MQSRLAKTPIQTAISTTFGPCSAVRESLDLALQRSAQGEVDDGMHVHGAHDDRQTATRFGYTDHLTQHAISVEEFHDCGRHRDIKTLVRKGDGFRVALTKLDDMRDTVFASQGCRFP